MKKLCLLCSIAVVLLFAGCTPTNQTPQTETGDFRFDSLDWGSDWEIVREHENVKAVTYEVSENGQRQTVKAEGLEYLGITLDVAGFVFDTDAETETTGLHHVFLQFSEEDEERLLEKLTEQYGEPKTFYTDKNGVENPITPAGWVSHDTLEDGFTEEELAYYLEILSKDYEQTRVDALLRSPLVSIRFDKDRNLVEWDGSTASVAAFVKKELKNNP